MDFLTIVANDYESALKQARSEHGQAVRVHTRKDFQIGSLLHPRKACKITFYLVDQKMIADELMEVEEPKEEVQTFDDKAYLSSLLMANAVPLEVVDEIRSLVLTEEDKTATEIEVKLLEYLLQDIQFETSEQKKYLLFLGNAGVGKTKAAVKIALFLRDKQGKKVAMLNFGVDQGHPSAVLVQLASQFSLPLLEANLLEGEQLIEQLVEFDHVLVDPCGFSGRDADELELLNQLYSLLEKDQCCAYLTVSASAKLSDLHLQKKWYDGCNLQSLVVTKLDETNAIGNILIFLKQSNLALAYISNGPDVVHDLLVSDAQTLMASLEGFSLDLTQFFPSP